MNRPNLTVHRDPNRAGRLTGTRAVGITAIGPAGTIELSADRIVLSAGAIESAHLLMLSGIGPADDLRAVGRRTVADLPVGRRTSDHPELVMPTTWTVAPADRCWRCSWWTTVSKYGRLHRGFISMVGDGAAGRPDWPHLGVALMRPRAAGGCRWCLRIPRSHPGSNTATTANPPTWPPCAGDASWRPEIVRGTTALGEPMWSTSQHLCAYGPMGTDGDEHAVVDPAAGCAVSTALGGGRFDPAADHQPGPARHDRDDRTPGRGVPRQVRPRPAMGYRRESPKARRGRRADDRTTQRPATCAITRQAARRGHGLLRSGGPSAVTVDAVTRAPTWPAPRSTGTSRAATTCSPRRSA